ncbi:uncharacterized protein FIBRA_05636 [Fibroporia radiculosa]|uniref:UspA domain-containing protein n=1 Tax=Fibroporia radiculosa TaxID=599839 RepID=J4HXV6_9APHY|nr:uncharacterized protein FIBRA_05636 [Fibroporia radiculosa]CCM03502.1 predicted protein [Fibroporia radiculosa]
MSDVQPPPHPRKRSWIGKYGAGPKDPQPTPSLPTPREGYEQSFEYPFGSSATASSSTATLTGALSRSNSLTSIASLLPSRLAPPAPLKRSSTTNLLIKDDPDSQNALSRTVSTQSNSSKTGDTNVTRPPSGSFSRMTLSSMMGGLSSLSLSRSTAADERGRSEKKSKDKGTGVRSSSYSGASPEDQDATRGRTRSQSPFRLRRTRTRDPSPAVEALTASDIESDTDSVQIRPRNAFTLSSASVDESGDETEDDDDDDDSWSDEDAFDPVTESNTERNALIPADLDHDVVDVPDPLGEGVNVVVPPEPYFPSTLNGGARNPRRRKSMKPDALPLSTSRPEFQRDRCTITLCHGHPQRDLDENGRRGRRYVLASDLSDESRYALEWGIGTVLRDGDEMLIVTVIENENKIDPPVPNPTDRTAKLRSQQERQALAYILVRQATSLLQRTRLNVTIACQAWHAKNRRHMLLDIVDYFEPSMLIVGSRGLGNLKGSAPPPPLRNPPRIYIPLSDPGELPRISISAHRPQALTLRACLQKCSVPVMVARRRLKRPPRRSAHLAPHRARVSLAQAAGVDRMAPKVDQDVEDMRTQIEQQDDDRQTVGQTDVDDDADTEVEVDQIGRNVSA